LKCIFLRPEKEEEEITEEIEKEEKRRK